MIVFRTEPRVGSDFESHHFILPFDQCRKEIDERDSKREQNRLELFQL